MADLPMFPLGSVLFPYLPLHLRVFEQRYLVMLSEMLQPESAESAEFGVVLIERGQEVGGGEHRFSYGTVAQITQLGSSDGMVVLVAQGERRFAVSEWLAEAPYPRARVDDLPELEWDEVLRPLRDETERLVRRSLALASEFEEQQWQADFEVSDDPVAAAWQLAGIAPLGALDQMALLRATSMKLLLGAVIEFTTAAAETFSAPWPED